jgi:anaerobic magnesium-protoporphyrin IX monomethyl ester cyclase
MKSARRSSAALLISQRRTTAITLLGFSSPIKNAFVDSVSMIDLLLTHSYFLHFDPKEYRAMKPYPPLGTLYAASVLRQRGFTVALHDVMFADREEELLSALHHHQPRLVVIYDDQFNYLTKMCLSRMRTAALRMIRLAKDHGCMVILFSSDASDHLDTYFAHGADYVICGEAEQTLAELAERLLRGTEQTVDDIRGLAYRHNGSITRTPKRELITHLDELPFPAWDLVDLERYRSRWKKRHGYFSLNLVTTRGCPFHCNWCAKPIYGQVYHSRSPENVVEEMKFLKRFAKPDHVWFADDIFGLKPGWVTRFDEAVNQANAKIPFKCLSRVDLLLKEDNIRHLKHAGCETVWVGAESGSQKILDAMEKGTTVEQIYEATALLHTAGIRVGFFLQFGYPGETKADIAKTLRVVQECQPDEIGISVSYPLPGTKFYERVKQQLGEKQNWVDSQDLDLMFAGEYHPDFYRALHRVVHKKFSVWRGIRTAEEVLRTPSRLTKQSLRSIASMLYHGVTLPLEMLRLHQLERLPVLHDHQ